MKDTEQDMEDVLRRAPVPVPKPGLEAKLIAELRREAGARPRRGTANRPGFWRRWWPVGLPGLATAALAAVVVVQQAELRDLRSVPVSVAAVPASGDPVQVTVAAGRFVPGEVGGTTGERDVVSEIERLRALVASLSQEVAGLERIRDENQRLLAEIAGHKGKLAPELQEMEAMKDKAQRIQCVNNLKQLGLAVRIWASDHQDEFPTEMGSLGGLVGAMKCFVCPADTSRQPASDASTLTEANCSYDFLAPGPGNPTTEPMRVMWRCPIHRNVTLVDGSVQMLTPERYEQMETRDGKLYMMFTSPPPNVPGSPQQP